MVTILDHCPSCGKCSRPGVCPTDAIKVENGKTSIVEAGCIDCGLCIPVCPIGVIVVVAATEQPVEEPRLAEMVAATPPSVDDPNANKGKEATLDVEAPNSGV